MKSSKPASLKKMANRHLSRSIVMQTLFERDSRREIAKGNKVEGIVYQEDLDEIIERDAQEFAPGMGDFSFVKTLALGIIEKQETLDNIIEKAAPDWPINRISIVDRNILRIGLYELLFSDYKEVPPKVAINEAIELAKTFGGENSGKFVNGVLGAVYKEMGEPKKDEVGSKKNATPIDISKLPIEKLGGALVYSKYKTGKYIALVHDIFGHWTLPKGHITEEEKEEDGTQREIKKELGIDITVLEKLGENEYIASNPEKGKIRKHVSYFLTETNYQELILEKSGGLDKAQWFKLEDITDLNIYDDILPIITKGIALIAKHSK